MPGGGEFGFVSARRLHGSHLGELFTRLTSLFIQALGLLPVLLFGGVVVSEFS